MSGLHVKGLLFSLPTIIALPAIGETATVTYKAITVLTPSYLSNLFTKITDRNLEINLRNAANDLYIPKMTTSKGQKAISFRGAKTWNQPSSDIKEANSLNSFKCKPLQPTV